MIVVASSNGNVGMAAAVAVLRAGGSALDAVEAATRLVEDNQNDHTVGVGGYPNVLGEVELDASLMEGTTRRAGAVAALQGYAHPIAIARAVLDYLPHHVLLVGAGAARFARERGFAEENLLTADAHAAWQRATASIPPNVALSVRARIAQDPAKTAGTVNFLARDRLGRIASAVSTSGWAFKYPGRVGDSPLVGCGNYCDDRWGACACTGLGEWCIRSGTAHRVVLGMQFGLDLHEACREAMHDLAGLPLPPNVRPVMNLVALDRQGNHAGYALDAERPFYKTYVWQTPDMEQHESTPCTVVAVSPG